MLQLFNEYFVALILIASLIVIIGDRKYFIRQGRDKEAKKAKFIGMLYIGIALVLYISNKLR